MQEPDAGQVVLPKADRLGLFEPALVPEDVAEGIEAETDIRVVAELSCAYFERSSGRGLGVSVISLKIDQRRLMKERTRKSELA